MKTNLKLLIVNIQWCHYEIIESVIIKHKEILNLDSTTNIDIYLHIYPNDMFQQYISIKYPKIKFETIKKYDYYINCTIYDKDFKYLDNKKESKKKYISHEITERLKTNPNIYFLTPLSKSKYIYTDILPYSKQKKIFKLIL